MKRILFDTNIIIKREDPNVLPADFIELNKTINDLNYKIFVHPMSIRDVNRDKNEERKKISLSKLETYSQIKNPPQYENDIEFKKIVGFKNKDNDIVDNYLLYAVYKDAVDMLITEDKEIISKSLLLGLSDRVLNITEATILISKDIPIIQEQYLISCFEKVKGWNIDLNDSIFDSLKKEYDFENWWKNKVSRTERDVYVYFSNALEKRGKIKAILVLKEEIKEEIKSNPKVLFENILKICLFKVDESTRGMRLGERLLKMAFEEARLKKITKLYLTHFTKNNEDKLVSLIETYGFRYFAKKEDGESIYYKEIIPSVKPNIKSRANALDFNKEYFPGFYDGNIVSKYIIPIKPNFFKRLFPDCKSENEMSMQLSLGLNIKGVDKYSSEGFSIQKAYICNTPVRSMLEGDILLFYRTDDYKSILALGTIEKVYYNINDADEIYQLIKRRTVYNLSEIKEKCETKKAPVVILFKHNLNFDNDVKYQQLVSGGIINGTIQTVRNIKENSLYERIIKGNIDESLIINKT